MKNNQLLQYLSELPNWAFTKKNCEYMQNFIDKGAEPGTIGGFVEFEKDWYCKFSKKKISKEVLDEFKHRKRFKTTYLAEVEMTPGLTDSRNASYPPQKIFQQNIDEHLKRSALSEIAKKHSLNYGTKISYKTHWICDEDHETSYTHLVLTKLIFSPDQLESLFQATKEWSELLNTKKYQNIEGNISRKIKRDLKTIIGEGCYQK